MLLFCTVMVLTGCGKQVEGKPVSMMETGLPSAVIAAEPKEMLLDGLEAGPGQEDNGERSDITEANQAEDSDKLVNSGQTETADRTADSGRIVSFGDRTTMNNAVGDRELPIYCVDTQEKKVALSFDAAWGNEDTETILSILGQHDVHVTFFMTGGWVEAYPDDVKRILEAGHDLGNHSENHKNMSELSDVEKAEELLAVHRKVEELTGYEMFLFRPPYGDYDNGVIDVAKDCGYYAIQWDVDSLDWQDKGVDSILATVTGHKNLGNGSIILCHNGGAYTAQALDGLLTELEEQGYEVVPISELIYSDNFHMDYAGRQIKN